MASVLPPPRGVLQPLRIASELRRWIAGYLWHHAVTLTTRCSNTVQRLLAELEKRFIRRLENKSQRAIAWFCVFERTHAGRWHAHALLAGTERLSVEVVCEQWKLGQRKAERIYAVDGAVGYITKNIDAMVAEGEGIPFELSSRLLAHDGRMVRGQL